MLSLNLLPWREQQYQYRRAASKKIFLFIILMACGVNALLNYFLHQREMLAEKHLQQLQQHLQQDRQPLLATSHAAADFSMNKLFAELGNISQKNICFSQLETHENNFIFTGKARSARDLSYFLLNWKGVQLFSDMQVSFIEKENETVIRFGLLAKKQEIK